LKSQGTATKSLTKLGFLLPLGSEEGLPLSNRLEKRPSIQKTTQDRQLRESVHIAFVFDVALEPVLSVVVQLTISIYTMPTTDLTSSSSFTSLFFILARRV
jgi:hypothetical protein